MSRSRSAIASAGFKAADFTIVDHADAIGFSLAR
jgi:hypothetical protein